MESPFEKKAGSEDLNVQVADTFYSGNEIIAYFDEILSALVEQDRSLKNKSQFINMARILIRKRENRKAASVVHQALTRYPEDLSILKLKTEIFLNMKDYESALMSVKQAMENHPQDISLLMLKARVYSLSGDDKSEEAAYKEIMGITFQDFEIARGKLAAMRRLANLYFKNERFKEAADLAEKILRKSPDEATWAMFFTIMMRLGKSESSQKSRDEFARFKRAKVYFDRGSEYEMQGKFNLALSSYRRGLDIYPKEPSVSIKVGNIFMYRKNWYSRAEEFIRKAVELDPEQASYRSNLVLCLKNQGKYKEAYEEAKIAERIDPLSNIFHLRRLAIKVGKQDEFVQMVEEAIERDASGNLSALRYELGLFYESQGNQEDARKWYMEALEIYKEQARNFPNDWELYMELGNTYKRLKMFPEAEASFKIAEQIQGCEIDEVYEGLLDLYQESGQPEKSTSYLKKLIKENPGKLVNYIDLGINYLSIITHAMRKKDSEI